MLNDFKLFLEKKRAVNDRLIPFFLKWVLDCYQFNEKVPPDAISDDQIQKFIKMLQQDNEDWQVEQVKKPPICIVTGCPFHFHI